MADKVLPYAAAYQSFTDAYVLAPNRIHSWQRSLCGAEEPNQVPTYPAIMQASMVKCIKDHF
ncbi:Mitochondrial carrier protein [Sesbania bispinosa]|nr:Mitochondrial carrier protein [Sesbania bispinosa]